MMRNKISFLIIGLLCSLSAETQIASSKKNTINHVCPPCGEPVPGTALWHYMKGVEEIMGIKTNSYLANEHFKRAADMDYAPAIKALADSHYSGDGIEKDREKSLALYIRAADLGDGSAQFNAGVILLRGYAGEPNYELSFFYLCLATMNAGLDEMAQDAAIYRDEAAQMLTAAQEQEVYRKLATCESAKPNIYNAAKQR